MELFLDSADEAVIETALEMWHIDGITTNPINIERTGKPFLQVVKRIGELVIGTNKTVSIPVNPHHHDDYQKWVDEAHRLIDMNPNFVIKMACTEHGLKACQELAEEGVRTHMNYCFNPMQVLQAMRMDATFVSPFISWQSVTAEAARQFIQQVMNIRDNYKFETEVLVSSVKTIQHVTEAGVAGANIVTAPPDVFHEAFANPLTLQGLARAQEAWDKIPLDEISTEEITTDTAE